MANKKEDFIGKNLVKEKEKRDMPSKKLMINNWKAPMERKSLVNDKATRKDRKMIFLGKAKTWWQ